MFRAIGFHKFLHLLKEKVFYCQDSSMSIKSTDNNPTHISQSQLARLFLLAASRLVFKAVSSWLVLIIRLISAIYIHNMKCFSMLYNKVASTFNINRLSRIMILIAFPMPKCSKILFLPGVKASNIFSLLGSNFLDIGLNFL